MNNIFDIAYKKLEILKCEQTSKEEKTKIALLYKYYAPAYFWLKENNINIMHQHISD